MITTQIIDMCLAGTKIRGPVLAAHTDETFETSVPEDKTTIDKQQTPSNKPLESAPNTFTARSRKNTFYLPDRTACFKTQK
jgi:hypothetical protein